MKITALFLYTLGGVATMGAVSCPFFYSHYTRGDGEPAVAPSSAGIGSEDVNSKNAQNGANVQRGGAVDSSVSENSSKITCAVKNTCDANCPTDSSSCPSTTCRNAECCCCAKCYALW